MAEWYMGLDTLMRIFWGCAIFSSAIFIIQTAMSFIGMDSDADVSFDADISGDMDGGTLSAGGVMSMFSVRGLINLLLGFGWTGVCLRGVIASNTLLVIVSLAAGVGFVFLCALLMKSLLKLEHNGVIQPESVVGCGATVYLRIPEGGTGKIQLTINGSVREYEAIAEHEIPTGAHVKVVEMISSDTFKVETI